MKERCASKTLDQIAQNLDSQRIPTTKADRVGGKYPYYGASGIVDYVSDYLFEGDALLVSEDGANLLARATPIAFSVSGRYWVNNHAHILKFEHFVTQRFVEYYLESISLAEYITGAAQPKLNQRALNSIPIPYPSLGEQRRIVALLDAAFEGIATAKTNAEKNRLNSRQAFESHLEKVFSRRCEQWPETSLGAVAQVKGGRRVPKGYKLLSDDTGYPYLRVTDFGLNGSIDLSDLRYISAQVHAEIKNYRITPADLYISIAGTIGRTGIIPEELDGANLTENACRLVFKPGVNNRFVYYYTKTPSFVEQAGFNTRTAAQPKLALSRLATIRLPMPGPEVQASVVASLDTIAAGVEKLEVIYERKVAALDELKQSLLHQAFSGAL